MSMCRNGCNFDAVYGWLAVKGCPVHDAPPEAPIPCALCGFDLRRASQDHGLFIDGALRHMTDFHALNNTAALATVGQSERAAKV